MKRILLILTVLAVAFGASAKFRWGPTVGANFSTYHWTQSLIGNDMKPGFAVGLQGELMIPGIGFGVDMAVKYVNRGGKVCFGDRPVWAADGIGDVNLRLHTIQVPIDLRFKWTRMNGIENYVAPFVYVGPQFNFHVASTKCPAVNRAGASVGIQCGIGAEIYKDFQISAGYVWDVTYDIETRKLDDFSSELQGWLLDLTWFF